MQLMLYLHTYKLRTSNVSFLLFSLLSSFCVQLYEQILAENEKLKAQLRDTDLELADLKLQLEKATQVRLSCRAAEMTII